MRGKVQLLACVVVTMVLFSFAGVLPSKVGAQSTSSAQNFTINSFDADYYLDREANGTPTLSITETINATFPDYDQNHGILRAIPERYQNHTLSLKIQSVRDPNGALPYTTDKQNGNLVLKIGSADKYVHGNKTYIIQYTMRNVISFQNDHDEFYWDVNGNDWPQTFGSVTARVHIPQNIAGSMQDRQKCYEGILGSTSSSNCTISSSKDDNGDTIVLAESHFLQPNSTLTFVLGFKAGIFKLGPEIKQENTRKKLLFAGYVAGITLPPVIAFVAMYKRWRKFGKDPKGKGVIVPEYQPPKGFNPIKSDYLLHEKLNTTALSATIIDLAVRKYIAIFETESGSLFKKKTYELELLKPTSELLPEEQQVMTLFFGKNADVGKRIAIANLKNTLYQKIQTIGKDTSKQLFNDGYFLNDPQLIRHKYVAAGIVCIIIGVIGVFTIFLIPFSIGFILCGLIVLGFSGIMPSRSEKGITIRDSLLGLKEYMKLAEAERINYLQSPAGAEKITASADAGIDPTNPKDRVKLFEKLLPYAMLFGLEKEWAKQFADVYTEAPDWYRGNWSTFSTLSLVNSVSGFTTTTAASFSAPSSSSGSGFSGGGGSGGGGGGGGGGGW